MEQPKPTHAQKKHMKQAQKRMQLNPHHQRSRPPITKAQRMKLINELLLKVSMQAIKGNKQDSERVVFEGFMQLGGVYVKFLQLLMLKTQFFSSLTAGERMSVYDEVAPDQLDVKELLRSQIGDHYLRQIAFIDERPFAGGSFGQVYFARHINGTPLIVKVLRPSLAEHIQGDLRVLGIIVTLLKGQIKIATDVGSLFKDFRKVVLRETDYVTEARNASYFYNYFKDNPQIVIPRTFDELCGSTIIVQEYVDGLAITDLIKAVEQGHDAHAYVHQKLGSNLTEQMTLLGRELIKSIFVAENIFGDPHPGNLKLMSHNRVGIIDFGIAGQTPADQRAFMILLKDIVNICEGRFDPGITFINGMRLFTPDLYRSINTISMTYAHGDGSPSIMDEIKKASVRAFEDKRAQADIDQLIRTGRISTIMNGVINEGNKFSLHVVMDPGIIVTIRTADGYVSLLDALGMTEQLIPGVIKIAIDDTHRMGAMLKGRGETIDLETAVNVINDWAQSLIESDPLFFAPLIQRLRRSGKRYAPISPPPRLQNKQIPVILSRDYE